MLNLEPAEAAALCEMDLEFIEEPHGYIHTPTERHLWPVSDVAKFGAQLIVDPYDEDAAPAVPWVFSEEDREVGRAVHAALAYHLRGMMGLSGGVDVDSIEHPRVRRRYKAGVLFIEESGFQPLLVEQRVWSHMGFAGTLDAVGMLAGKLTIIDWKGVIDAVAVALQTAGYAIAFAERTGANVENRIAVGLTGGTPEKPRYNRSRPMDSWLEDSGAFTSALTLLEWRRKFEMGIAA